MQRAYNYERKNFHTNWDPKQAHGFVVCLKKEFCLRSSQVFTAILEISSSASSWLEIIRSRKIGCLGWSVVDGKMRRRFLKTPKMATKMNVKAWKLGLQNVDEVQSCHNKHTPAWCSLCDYLIADCFRGDVSKSLLPCVMAPCLTATGS